MLPFITTKPGLLVAPRLAPSRLCRLNCRTVMTSNTPSPSANTQQQDLVQYVLLRTDLNWPMGSLVAQGIHAAMRASHPADDPDTIAYVSPTANGQMTTLVLEAKNESALHKTSAKLDTAGVRYALWVEQPEGTV